MRTSHNWTLYIWWQSWGSWPVASSRWVGREGTHYIRSGQSKRRIFTPLTKIWRRRSWGERGIVHGPRHIWHRESWGNRQVLRQLCLRRLCLHSCIREELIGVKKSLWYRCELLSIHRCRFARTAAEGRGWWRWSCLLWTLTRLGHRGVAS